MYEQERRELQARLAELDQRERDEEVNLALQSIDENEARLATAIHSLYCRSSHIDQCGWEYKMIHGSNLHDWAQYAHLHYLERARLALASADYATAVRLAAVMLVKERTRSTLTA